MIKANNQNTLFLSYDIRNYVEAAISSTQLLIMDKPELVNDINITAIVESIVQTVLLTKIYR